MLCQYRDSFGKVGEGLHAYRVFDVAVVDVVLTVCGAYIIRRLWFPQHAFIHILLAWFVAGIVMHRVFCVRTTVDKALFP